jgi:hypothetical protein
MSGRKRVVIVGSSFAGLTSALELVLDPRSDFTFIPSLIWLPSRLPSGAPARGPRSSASPGLPPPRPARPLTFPTHKETLSQWTRPSAT